MSNLTSNQHWIMHYAHCTALCMLCQPTWFMFAMLGGIPEWCIPLILTWDCEIGKTGLAGMHASLGRALLKPEFSQKQVFQSVHTKYWFTRIIWGITHYPGLHSSPISGGRIVAANSSCLEAPSLCSVSKLPSGQALSIVQPLLLNFTITFTPQKAPVTPQ